MCVRVSVCLCVTEHPPQHLCACADTESVEMKRYDLMHSINERGTFMCTKLCLPYLKKVCLGLFCAWVWATREEGDSYIHTCSRLLL